MSLQFHRPERQQNPLQCAEHQNEQITNYCSALDCLKPLCPECMSSHNILHKQKHTYPEVESIRGVINNSQKRLKEAGVSFQKEIINIENQIHEPQVYHQESIAQMQKLKKQILGLVEIHFQELEHKLTQSAQDMNKKFMHLSPSIEKIKQFQREIEIMYKQLDPHDPSLFQALQKVQLLDVDQFLDKFKGEMAKQIQSMNFEQLILRLEDASPRLQHLKSEIEKCVPLISYRHHPPHPGLKPQKFTPITQSYVETVHSYVNHNPISRDDTLFNQNDSPRESVHNSFQATESKIRKLPSTIAKPSQVLTFDHDDSKQYDSGIQNHIFHINQPDFFLKSAQRKFLHFFQNDSTNLFYFDLTTVGQRGVSEFQLIEINNNFVIPSFHRSIATPQGNLYLVGGTLSDGQKSGITYQFDFQSSSLQAISMMLYPRSSHGLVYLNGYIYAIGGYEQKHIMTSKCERMSLKGKWESIASLNQVCTSMSICAFGKDYLYKYGGITANYSGQYISNTIERYDANLNVWKIVELNIQSQIQHLSTSACVQINQTDMLIFGGYNEENIGSNQSYLLTVGDGQHTLHSVNHKPLPFSEAFWNSQTVIFEGNLYVLQNVSGESDDSCLEDERLLLLFNGREWKTID